MRWGGRGEHDQKNSRFPPPPKMNNVQILQPKKRKCDHFSTRKLIKFYRTKYMVLMILSYGLQFMLYSPSVKIVVGSWSFSSKKLSSIDRNFVYPR